MLFNINNVYVTLSVICNDERQENILNMLLRKESMDTLN